MSSSAHSSNSSKSKSVNFMMFMSLTSYILPSKLLLYFFSDFLYSVLYCYYYDYPTVLKKLFWRALLLNSRVKLFESCPKLLLLLSLSSSLSKKSSWTVIAVRCFLTLSITEAYESSSLFDSLSCKLSDFVDLFKCG